ncbi:Kinesin-like protein klpA [Bienertia sinuspersici]
MERSCSVGRRSKMVIYKGKTVSGHSKFTEACGTSKNAGTSKFKVYSEKKKVNNGIVDNADAKPWRTSVVSNKGSVLTSTKTKVGMSGAPVARSSHDSLDKAKVRRKALADVSNTKGQSSRFDKPSGPRSSMTFGTYTTTTSSNRSVPVVFNYFSLMSINININLFLMPLNCCLRKGDGF